MQVHGLGKEYVIGAVEKGYRTFREALVDSVAAPFNRLRSLGGDVKADERFWALRDVSFSVKPGEVVGIIGRNGAGKSTLLKILSRITAPTTGRAMIRGRVASLLEVGTGFHSELTGRENIYLNAAILGMTRQEINRKFDEIVAFAEVDRFLDTPVKRYSSGMSVRLAFSVAAHLEPEILIVDEVLAVGDAAFQEKCLGKMNSVAHVSGRTVLFVSHNMAAVQQLCGRALLLSDGRLVDDGEPSTVVRAYFTAGRESATSVQDWRDRKSNGQGRIVAFEVLDEHGAPSNAMPVGGAVRFRITAELHQPLGEPNFGVLVKTAAGESMLDLRASHDGLRMGPTAGRVVVETTLRQLGLYPGEYVLSAWISDRSTHQLVDNVRRCAQIRVVPAPGPHGDLKLNPEQGKYFVPSQWNARREE